MEFEDRTLVEAEGNYDKVVQLMKEDGAVGAWMLRSKTFVQTPYVNGVFVLNFWDDGRVMIDELLRPISMEIPNDDLTELSSYIKEHGWKYLEPTNKMMENPRLHDFWKHQFQSGLIVSTVLEQREADIVERMIKSGANNDQKPDNKSDSNSIVFK